MVIKVNPKNLLNGDIRSLAKAITLIESRSEFHFDEAQDLLHKILPSTGKSIRIGITGTPGVGKSTFIEALGIHLISLGKKIAVLAIDPSSPIHGGSLLGDKTRMETLAASEQAFIRPSPSSGALGGVAHKTRETMLLCEAAGYEIILVETVGVGQSEIDVNSMVDIFVLLSQPNSGDELQGIKKGIMELADIILVNKADGDSKIQAERTKSHLENALHIFKNEQVDVFTCSALKKIGIKTIWSSIEIKFDQLKKENKIESKRKKQNKDWMSKVFFEMIDHQIKSNKKIHAQWSLLEKQVESGKITPFSAAKKIMEQL